MQLTIDSDQPLADVLRVVGAMYNVQLTSSRMSNATAPSAAPEDVRAGRRAPRRARSASKKRTPTAGSSAEMRAWGRENGYEVGDKGTLPTALIA